MKTKEIKKFLKLGLKITRPTMKNDFIFLKNNTVYLASTGKSYNPGVIGCEYFQWEVITDWMIL